MQHFLSIEQLTGTELTRLLEHAAACKAARARDAEKRLAGQTWTLLFNKPSTRTRVSFEVGIRELGGNVMFLSQSEIQLGRGEPIIDTARVLGRMVHGAIIRTFAQEDVVQFSRYSKIPTVNALTDEEHPCQIVADLLTIQERRGTLEGIKICFVGDGDCNVARSWIWAAERLGLELRIAAPENFQVSAEYRSRLRNPGVKFLSDIREAAAGVDVLYTDVWVSMGKEAESAERLEQLRPYQINRQILDLAAKSAIVLHCLPAYRDKEITEEILEEHADTIFDQAENRLHAQKAILLEITR